MIGFRLALIWARLAIAAALMLFFLALAIVALCSGSIFSCLVWLGVCAFIAGWPAAGDIRMLTQPGKKQHE